MHHNIVNVVNTNFHTIDLTSSHKQSTRKLPPVPTIDRATLPGYSKQTHIDDVVIVVLYFVSDALILFAVVLNDTICFVLMSNCQNFKPIWIP